MNLQVEDKSNKALTVGTLNVLGTINSDDMISIHTHLQTQDGVQSRIIADMKKLYESISADGVITANEKQMLKKELTIIETEYPIIVTKAETAKKPQADIDAYKQAFQKLYRYIYSELKIFDSMQTALSIDRDTFNAVFASYYSSRALLQINKDGLIFYTWIKFAFDAAGTGISDYPDGGRHWMGIAHNKLTAEESDNPEEYTWIDVQGKQGVAGAPGKDGKPRFIWVKYADSATGDGLSDNPDGKDYIGFAFNKETEKESSEPADYYWQKVKGEQGVQGIPGKDGSTKFLPSLEVSGDYENQIGTFQGRLYRWTGGKWELLNAVMPLNPVCHYDMADITNGKIIRSWGPIESTGRYYIYLCNLTDYKGQSVKITMSARKNGAGGYPCLYVFGTGWKWQTHTGEIFDSETEVTASIIVSLPTEYDVLSCNLYHWPESAMQNTIVVSNITIELLERVQIVDSSANHNHSALRGRFKDGKDDSIGKYIAFETGNVIRKRLQYIGTGKQWSHSRWIKIDTEQDKTTNPRLWYYGAYDYCLFSIEATNGKMSNIAAPCYKDKTNFLWCTLPKESLIDNQWHHLVVMTDLQQSYCRKIIYIDREKIIDKKDTGDFSNWTDNTAHTDMNVLTENYTRGSLANLLFFDRLLTEQEVLYLYLNPQYPLKNYTLADWAIDPANPDSSIKTLTPKYLGVVETVPTSRTVVITKGERLGAQDANAGDWVLMAKTVGGWKCGLCYRWTGSMWINLEPEYNYTEQYQAALYHICEIDELMQNTGHFGALFAKVIVAQQAFIDKLVAQEAFIKQLATEQAFLRQLIVQKLHIDSDSNSHHDFEAWFDEINGLKIKNKGEEIFRVDIAGNVFAKHATLIDAYFSGNIVSGPLELLNSEPSTQKITLMSNSTATSIVEKYGAIDIICENINGGTPVHRFITMAVPFITSVPIYEWDYSLIPPKMVFKEWKIVSGVTNTVQFFTNSGDKTYTNNETITEDYVLSSKKGAKTFKLKNIPTTEPVDKDVVWVDSSGCLRLS